MADSFWIDLEPHLAPAHRDPTHWAPWTLDPDPVYPALDFGHLYRIELTDLRRPSRMLDMIIQVARKSWATDTVVAGLVRALNDLMNPQAFMCSMGGTTTLTERQVAKLVETGNPR